MKKGLFLLISAVLLARENPFVPIVNINNPSPIEEIKEFKKQAFNVPSDARVLNKMKLIYTNVDGTLKEFELDINEALDWHKVYMLLDAHELTNQNNEEKNTELKEVDKIKLALKEEDKEEDKTTKKEVNESKKEIKEEIKVKEFKPLEYYFSSDFSVIIDRKLILIKTYNSLLREFSLKNPNRIVLDFKTNYVLKNKIFNTKTDYVESIYSGVHKNFYRLVIRLDGIYDYDVVKNTGEYVIKLK